MGDASRSHELVGSVAGDGMHWIPSAETMHWLAVLCAHLQQNVFSTKTVIKVPDARRKHGMYDDASAIDRWFQGILRRNQQFACNTCRRYIHDSGPGPTPTLPAHGVVGLAVQPMPWFGGVRKSAEGEGSAGGAAHVRVRVDPARPGCFQVWVSGTRRCTSAWALRCDVSSATLRPDRVASRHGDEARRRGSVAVRPGIKGPRPG